MKLIINRIIVIDSIFFLWETLLVGGKFMYCSNCGNKVDDNAYVCVNCGVILKKRENVKRNKKQNSNVFGMFSLIFSVVAVLSSFSLFFYDISSVGMYTKAYERVIYGIGFTSISIFLTILSLIFALIKKSNLNKTGLVLTLISVFLILSEILVIIIY